MTALPSRRARKTVLGAVTATLLVLIAGGLAVAGAVTVVNSKAGETVAGETRPVVTFPNTDNAALAVVDDQNQLTALVIATLSPEGVGGSIVTIPVNADASIGLGDVRRPLDRELDLGFGDPTPFFEAVEGTLAISLQFGEIVSAERLGEMLDPVVPVDVELSAPVIDTLTPGSGRIVPAGESRMSKLTTVRALRAHDDEGASYEHHGLDVEIWSALSTNAPVADPVVADTDEFGRPSPSASIDEVFARLWSGPVQVRDLAVRSDTPAGDRDVVVIDRIDSLFVFAQASPARVTTPNPGLVFRVVVPFTDGQLGASGGPFATRSDAARGIMGELLFLLANVVSVDTRVDDGAQARSVIEVADERFIADMETLVPLVFGDADVVVAPELIDGVDVVLTLGTGYLDLKREQGGVPDAAAVDDVSTTDAPATGDTVGADG